MASNVAKAVGLRARFWNIMKTWSFKNSGYRQLGLFRDDVFHDHWDPDVIEAVRRLPPDVDEIRNYRMKKAMDLSMKHRILPEDQWTTMETDVRYLQPYINQVLKEKKERASWERY